MNVKNQHSWKWLGFWVMALECVSSAILEHVFHTLFKFLYRLNYMVYKAELDIGLCDAQFKTSHSLVWVRVHQRRALQPHPT